MKDSLPNMDEVVRQAKDVLDRGVMRARWEDAEVWLRLLIEEREHKVLRGKAERQISRLLDKVAEQDKEIQRYKDAIDMIETRNGSIDSFTEIENIIQKLR